MTASVGFRAIGVDCRIVATREAALSAARELARARLAQLDSVASRFRPDSEVMALAREPAPLGARTITEPASPVLRALIEDALWAAGVTDGLVDPTLGHAMEASGYDADLPAVLARPQRDASAGASEPATIGRPPASTLRDLRIDPVAGTVTIAAGALLDLGATAKATTADRIARELGERWPGGFLVDLGGDIAVAGRAPIGGWVISTDHDSTGEVDRIAITTQGVATSGTDRRRWYVDGALRHHLLDPVTGRPVARTWRHVTCIGASALEANTASTAACVLADHAPAWLGEHGIPARLVPEHGAAVCTPGWPGAAQGRAS